MKAAKEISEKQALSMLSAQCSRGEHCSGEMLEKMRKWNLPDDAQTRVMEYLTTNHYIDDERFTRAFVRDKLCYNKWGRRKIEQALWQKHIPQDISAPILDDVDQEEWTACLAPLLKSKRKSITARSAYEMNAKLIRFAMSRGFTMDVIRCCLDGDDAIDVFDEI